VSNLRLPRRAVLGAALSVALVGGGLTAFAAAGGACPATYTDPAADAGPASTAELNPIAGDDDLDLVAVTHGVSSGQFSTTFKVVKLYDTGPNYAFADRYIAAFTVAGKAVTVTAERDFSGFGSDKGSAKVAGTTVTFPVKVVIDLKANTISAVMAVADLEKVMKTPLAGKPFSAMSATARAVYPSNAAPGTFQPDWDTAEAAASAKYVFGTGCGKTAAAPKPAPKPSASPSPSSSPKPSASPAPSGSPAATSTATTGDYPVAGCQTFKDEKGDASYNGSPSDPDLDITAYTLRTTAKDLVSYIKVDALGASPSVMPLDGHRFYSEFTFNKHVFSIAASSFANYGADLRDGASQTGQAGPNSVMSVDSEGTGGDPGFTDTKVTATFDEKASTVVLSVPLADIEKHGKAPLAGATLTEVAARAGADSGVLILQHDTTESETPAKDVYKVGDNHCFAAPTSPLSSVGAVKAQYADTAAVAARLLDAAGKPVAGKRVTFTLGAVTAAATTGSNGIAKATLLVREKAGRRSLVLSSDDLRNAVPFTVLVERVVLRATGSAGAVQATLTDDDGHAVALQTVTFTSGGRKVTARTDANGVAEATGFARDSTVTVAYAGVAGQYAPARASATA
jgi:hypothetical protein